MTENLSTKTDESTLIAQVLDLEERVDDVEKSLSALYAASKAGTQPLSSSTFGSQ